VLVALSLSFALNLHLVYALYATPVDAVLRATRIDPTVLLAVVQCALFGWLCVTFARVSREAYP